MKVNLKNISVYSVYLILIITITYLFYNLKFSTNEMNEALQVVIKNVNDENWELSFESFENFMKNYENKIKNFASIIRHDEVSKALLHIEEISTKINLKNKEECLFSLSNLNFYINTFYKNQIPNLLNVL